LLIKPAAVDSGYNFYITYSYKTLPVCFRYYQLIFATFTMRIKAIILDLDNIIYPVISIGNKLFHSLFSLIAGSGSYRGELNEIKSAIMRRPFQMVANDFDFSENLKAACLSLLSDLTYEEKIEPFDGYECLREIPCKKYLVTTGFIQLQQSKIKQLNIEKDFEGIFIIDPGKSTLIKKDIFIQILNDHHYKTDEVLVVGDDMDSEIKAAKELNTDTVLYNHTDKNHRLENQQTINNFKDLNLYIK